MAIAVQRKPVPLDAWHIADVSAMVAALGELTVHGWRGGLAPTSEAADTFRLELNKTGATDPVFAFVGDWLVLDLDQLRSVTAEVFAANYEAVPAE